ncbi:polysaccharide biosynthesis tyrosine autokinase [Pseudarthrobacter sp. IC2-21]|uniref:polysaccharide biosynthesis tyrosine autokinase n=1 Tax=Pseudarthrobacter sp. IC2-21 TaxID=3092262 RepID=UPI002A6A4B3D|nr:polysaccharide biosynthesis tyrosine autokinase [Pseudarthrobacter sp. IC2-21]
MEIRDLFRLARQSWLTILCLTLLGLIVGGAAALVSKPTYTSETQLFVAIQNSGSVQELQQGNTFTQARVQSYVKAATQPVVLQPAIDALGLTTTPRELQSRVNASADLNTVLIKITAADASPVQAAALAQATANSLIKAVDKLETPVAGGTSPVRLSVITPAVAPQTPSAPNTKLNLLLGAILGLFSGIGIAYIRKATDNRIRGESELRRVTDAPILAGIAFDSEATKSPLLTQSPAQSPRSESFRQLRTNLQFANLSVESNTILVTSSTPGEGKSTTAINLAIAHAQFGKSVCLIDADLRRPMVGEYLGLDRNAGLSSALIGAAQVEDLLQSWGEDSMFVLTSGQIPPNPSELLGSERMVALLNRLERTFDLVIIDTPPLLPVTDAAVLSQSVAGVILVVDAQKTKVQELEKSLGSLELVGAKMLGIVLNRTPTKGPDAYGAGAYSYESVVGRAGRSKGPVTRRGLKTDGHGHQTSTADLLHHVEVEGEYGDPEPASQRRSPSVYPIASRNRD